MIVDGKDRVATKAPTRWWREPEILFLLALVVSAYLVRIGDVPMRGEEPRRARVAFEILDSGDWVVPRQQGDPFLSRPPLQNWLLAASSVICGSREPWAVRLPSVIALWLTAVLIYGYARTCISRLGALAAAVAFVTFGEMFTTGCQAETEMLFIALVTASLFLWHWGEVKDWTALRTWTVSYFFVALGFLCKGPQPPVYFGAAVGSYLLLTGQWRRLFSLAHLAGIALFAVIALAWLVPCVLLTSVAEVWAIFIGDTAMRFHDWRLGDVLKHLFQFPFEVFGGAMPWSLLLLAFLRADVRRTLGAARPHALFLGLAVFFAFLTCWIPPGGQTRYFSPLYPALAVLIGFVVEGSLAAVGAAALPSVWRRTACAQFGWILTGAMGLSAVGVVVISLFLREHKVLGVWAESLPAALGFALIAIGLSVLTWKASRSGKPAGVRLTVLGVAAFMVLTCTGYATNSRIRRANDHAANMASLKFHLPPDHKMVSFGLVEPLFNYYYDGPIERLPLPPGADALQGAKVTFFCFNCWGGQRPTLPFAWEEVGVVPMDRARTTPSSEAVVVGRRIDVPSMPQAVIPVSRPR